MLTRCDLQTSHTADLRYMYCRIAYHNYSKALFEDAGSYFQKSKIDPRFVIRLLSRHIGKSIALEDEATIWHGAEPDSTSAEDSGSIGRRTPSELFEREHRLFISYSRPQTSTSLWIVSS